MSTFWRVKSVEQQLASARATSLQRSLGPIHLILLGIGAIIGTGIFVLTAVGAQKAGPGMMMSFVVAGSVCALAALCYAEMATMVPVSGSAYTFSYAVLGEYVAWMVGWALVLEYTLSASTVSVGWSGYFVGLLNGAGIPMPTALTKGPTAGGIINLPAALVALLVTALLIIGTRASATFNAVLVAIKLLALGAFLALSLPVMDMEQFEPFAPLGWGGISAAAATIFFAFLGFDAVATASEETKNPQRSMPIGILGSLTICTVLYLLVAAGVIGTVGAQPLVGPDAAALTSGTSEHESACRSLGRTPLVCSREPLAFAIAEIGWPQVANLLRLAVAFTLPSVVLLMLFAQTRIFFVMSRDGLLPRALSRVHPRYRTPHIITMITGAVVVLFASLAPLARLADLANAGTLFAFLVVAIVVMVQRIRAPHAHRPFKLPFVWALAPLTVAGCGYLMWSLDAMTKISFLVWSLIGIAIYLLYGHRRSPFALGTAGEKKPCVDQKLQVDRSTETRVGGSTYTAAEVKDE